MVSKEQQQELSSLILPLKQASSEFLQVLTNEFVLQRLVNGVQLSLQLRDSDRAIWRREAKSLVRSRIHDFDHRAQELQDKLDQFLLGGDGDRLEFPMDGGEPFPFRYASGGTLPIVRVSHHPNAQGRRARSKEYYVLFFREISPIGWNIANGGCDSIEELLNPSDTIARELREELLLIDRLNRKRYVFGEDVGKSFERPEFAAAKSFWEQIFKEDPKKYEAVEVPIKWLRGPDEIRVRYDVSRMYSSAGHFLNVNALDFGIEADGIAKIHVDQDVALCDGEILHDRLVNAPVGLFEVERFNEQFRKAKRPEEVSFRPDYFYWSGARHEGGELESVLESWIPTLAPVRLPGELTEYEDHPEQRYRLCPVTRRIITRYLNEAESSLPADPYDVFLSFASEDESVARAVYEYLTARPDVGSVFYSSRTLSSTDFGKAIDEALETARCLVVVGTKQERLRKGWVEWEWQAFHNSVKSGLKPGAEIVSYIHRDLNLLELPLPLRNRQCVQFSLPGENLEELGRWVRI